ncbi:hypothetical protein AAHC03_04895 [Spirometra sp. Aus1]|nr:unnamed protein product [Spirometra erinaceieuropaei]
MSESSRDRGKSEPGEPSSSQCPPEGNEVPSSSTSGTTGSFECNICLESAKDAVVSRCGHLFCWPCLHQWFETVKSRPSCPVCKAAISRDSVIPLYGRGGDHKTDPRSKIPPRPPGQRTEPQQGSRSPFEGLGNLFGGGGGGGGGAGGHGNFHMSVGVGAFPFGLFTTTFNVGGGAAVSGDDNVNGNNAAEEAETMSKLFMAIAVFFIVWLFLS